MNIRILCAALATFSLLLSAPAASAQTRSEQAKAHVAEAGAAFIDALADTSTTETEKSLLFKELITRYTDIRWMAGFVAGRAAASADKAEKEAYFELYPEYLVKTYLPKYGQFKGRTQTVKSVQEDIKGFLVITHISNGDNEPIDLRYRVRFKDDKPMIFDVLAEGVSLIVTQRSEFASFIERKGFSVFVQKMRDYIAS